MFFQLLLITAIPVCLAIAFYHITKYTKFKNLNFWTQQIIIGVVFGLCAISGTEFGVSINGLATANVRDAAPLIAGLLFGGPAGIIAGCIGGIERFFAVYWGAGYFTRWACSISTILAGIYAALLRKYMFKDNYPSWILSLAVGLVMEVVHFTLVFLTNISETAKVMEIISALAIPMIVCTSVATALPVIIILFVNKDVAKLKYSKISSKMQWWLLSSVVFCYIISTTIVYSIETNNAYQKAKDTFDSTISDVINDVSSTAENYMISILNEVKQKYTEKAAVEPYDVSKKSEWEDFFRSLLTAEDYDIYSVDLINNEGEFIISSATDFDYQFNMSDSSYSQSYEIHQEMSKKNAKTFVQSFQMQGDSSVGELKKYAAIRIDENYYLVISLNADQFYTLVNEKVGEITSYRHVKNDGFILILDGTGKIVSDRSYLKSDFQRFTLKSFSNPDEYNTLLSSEKLFEEDSFYMYNVVETYTIVIILPYDDVLAERDSSFMLNSFMEVIVFAILYGLIFFLVDSQVVGKIENVNESLGKIIEGDLNIKVDVTSSMEFAALSRDINYTVDTLKRYIDEAAKRIDDELAFAKTIQASALPSTFPAFPDRTEFDIFATMDTAKEVGGDFYDFYIVDSHTLAFLIADVSGKGIPAAMFMMESKALIKNLAKNLLSPEEVMRQTNSALTQNNETNMFVTCWFGTLDLNTGHVKFANAGHNYPLIYRKGGNYEYIKQKKNLVLGAMDGLPYFLQEFDMKPGDKLYLYTDGVTEATRGDGKLYGEDRLATYLNKHKDADLKRNLLGIKEDIDEFVEGADQFDDITMLSIEYKGK